MRKKLLIAAGILVVIGAVYAFWDYNKLTALGKQLDQQWPKAASQYEDRLAIINKLKEGLRTSLPAEQELFSKMDETEKEIKEAKDVADSMRAIASMEKGVARMVMVLDKYPDVKNSPDIQENVRKLVGDSSSDWSKAYNDEVIKYNYTIHRIRNRSVTSMFGIKDKRIVIPARDILKAETEKAAKKDKKKSKEKTEAQPEG